MVEVLEGIREPVHVRVGGAETAAIRWRKDEMKNPQPGVDSKEKVWKE